MTKILKYSRAQRAYDDKAGVWAEEQMRLRKKPEVNISPDYETPVPKEEYRAMLKRFQKNAKTYEEKQLLEKEFKNTNKLSNDGRRRR